MRSVLLALMLCVPAWAQGPFVGPLPRAVVAKAVPKPAKAPARGVSVPEEVRVKPGRLARVEASSGDGKAVRWINVHADLDLIESETGRWAIISSPTAGRYKLACYSDGGGPPAYVVVVVGDAPPGPDPGPGPTPKPPDPKPAPTGGMRVLIVYESAELAKVPEAQQGILYGKQSRDALNALCEQDGAVKGWRMWDADVDASAEGKAWQEAMKRPRTALPWLLVTRGGLPVHEGPLPADVPAFLALIQEKAKATKGGR